MVQCVPVPSESANTRTKVFGKILLVTGGK